MKSTQNHNEIQFNPQDILPDGPLSRVEAFRIWRNSRRGKTLSSIAKTLGISISGVSRLVHDDRISSARHAQLVQAGIPEKFLPPVEDVKPGPKPKE